MKILKIGIINSFFILSACQSHFAADSHLGSSVNSAIQNQTVNPHAASMAPKEVRGMDGVSAKTSIDSYQNSFIRRLPGVGAPTSGQGGATGSFGGSNPGTSSGTSIGTGTGF
jgi:hypothetical protein